LPIKVGSVGVSKTNQNHFLSMAIRNKTESLICFWSRLGNMKSTSVFTHITKLGDVKPACQKDDL
jgi:hypothetical protein